MVEFRELHLDELEKWLDHCTYSFNSGQFMRQYFAKHWFNDPWRDKGAVLIAVEEGQIQSAVRIFHREIYLSGQTFSMGGIGEVCTKPEYQGKGLAMKLLNAAIDKMRELGLGISMLGAAIGGLYSKLEWVQNSLYHNISDIIVKNTFTYPVRPMNFEADAVSVKRIYENYSARYSGAFVRNDDLYWTNWVRDDGGKFWVVENREGELIAYACAGDLDGKVFIKEFGALPGYENIFDDFVMHICKLLGKSGCEVKFNNIIKSNLKIKNIEEVPHYMYRLINPFRIGKINIDSTKSLIDALNGVKTGEQRSDFLFWSIDNF